MLKETMRHLQIYIFGFLILTSCNEPQSDEIPTKQQTKNFTYSSQNIPETYDRYSGIVTLNCGPRGGAYINSSGKSYFYRIFRIRVINDTVCPVELNINFPDKPVALLPDTNQFLKVFLFPDELTPDSVKDIYNFGVRRLEWFLDSKINKRTTLKTLIKPKEERILYIGGLEEGLARAKLFINGQDPNVSFLPITSIETDTKNKHILDLIFGIGIGISPAQKYSLIHCGQIIFKK